MRTKEQDKLNNKIQFLKNQIDLKEYIINERVKEIKKHRVYIIETKDKIVELQLQLKEL